MRRTIAAIGRTCIVLGVLILLFVAYQLWGTGIFTARAQAELKKDFKALEHKYNHDDPTVSSSTSSSTTTPQTATTAPPTSVAAPPPPAEGDVVGLISIPKIGVNKAVVEGTSRDDLKKGPGHYLGTPMPGQLGNAAIAGHRTTYGAPFNRIDELVPGDKIIVTMVTGQYTYEMFRQQIVFPTDVSVVDPPPNPTDAWLTLTSCHPKFSAARRIVVQAKLVPASSSKPAPPPARPKTTPKVAAAALQEGLSGQHRSLGPASLWGILVLAVGLGWWWAFRRWRHPLTWVAGVVPFVVVLFPFYVFLERALPSGY
jgi:sortase A